MYQEPTSHRIDPARGTLSAATGHYEKRLKDLVGIYQDQSAFERAVSASGDKITYDVHEVRPLQEHGGLVFGTTRMKPGLIGREFYMTRGHIHAVANRPEVYYGESGTGVMLMESPEGEARTLEVTPGVAVHVPPMWVHRSVNIGPDLLVMSFFYPSDSGQDYDVIARSGGMASLIVADDPGWKAVPNPNYRRRTTDEVARILATKD